WGGDFILQRGSHALKIGTEIHRYRWDAHDSESRWGVWSFNSLESFLQAGPEGTNLTVALPGSDNRTSFRQTLAGFYVQDNYGISDSLRLNLGVRYELASRIHDRNGRTAALRDPWRDGVATQGPLFRDNPSLRNLDPRVGISWSPWGSGNTVISGGFGIYRDQLIEYAVDRNRSAVPFHNVAVV